MLKCVIERKSVSSGDNVTFQLNVETDALIKSEAFYKYEWNFVCY